MDALSTIRIVLVEPEHPGNIGAAARAMANMGVRRLGLVAPLDYPSPIATARASGSGILDDALVFPTLDEAIAECTLVVAATARTRAIPWPHKTPEEAMQALLKARGPVALVFGRESSGLTNDELDRCHFHTRIPVDPSFSSMNLGSAVSVLLYELRRQAAKTVPQTEAKPDEACTVAELQHFYDHLEVALRKSGRDSDSSMRMLTRLFNRVAMRPAELRLLRGLFRSMDGRNKQTLLE